MIVRRLRWKPTRAIQSGEVKNKTLESNTRTTLNYTCKKSECSIKTFDLSVIFGGRRFPEYSQSYFAFSRGSGSLCGEWAMRQMLNLSTRLPLDRISSLKFWAQVSAHGLRVGTVFKPPPLASFSLTQLLSLRSVSFYHRPFYQKSRMSIISLYFFFQIFSFRSEVAALCVESRGPKSSPPFHLALS